MVFNSDNENMAGFCPKSNFGGKMHELLGMIEFLISWLYDC